MRLLLVEDDELLGSGIHDALERARYTVEWVRDGRRPTVFVHTPDNHAAPDLARELHAAVRALVPELAALPEPADVTDVVPDATPGDPDHPTLF